jgi:hypothetical protein
VTKWVNVAGASAGAIIACYLATDHTADAPPLLRLRRLTGGARMTLSSYGVLSARMIATVREGAAETPHYQVHVVDDDGTRYRVAVNVQSAQAPSELLYLARGPRRRTCSIYLQADSPALREINFWVGE